MAQVFYLDIIALGNILITFLSWLPLAINIRYYIRTKITDYGILSYYFFYWAVLQTFFVWFLGFKLFSLVYDGYNVKAEPSQIELFWDFFWIVVPLDVLPLAIVAIRGKYGSSIKDIPNLLIFITIIPIFTTLIVARTDLLNLQPISSQFATYGFWNGWFSRITYYSITAFCFYYTDYTQNNRARFSRSLWIWGSVFWIIGLLGFLFPLGLLGYQGDPPNLWYDLWSFIGITIAASLILLNHIAYPESVLITYEQLHRALKMYENIDTREVTSATFGLGRIKSYLENLPEDLKAEISAR